MDKYITTPITEEVTKNLKSGDYVYITGTIYVARDAAHKRMIEALERGENLPIDIKDATIYYMGPSPAREGRPIGSAGPTTSGRMDAYAPTMMSVGARGMIGKGARLPEVVEAMLPYFTECYGNPSSIYSLGSTSKKAVIESRETIAEVLGCKTNEIYFTAGGSEADNWAIKAAAEAYASKGKHIITSKIEHHAVLHTCEYLEKGHHYVDVSIHQVPVFIRKNHILPICRAAKCTDELDTQNLIILGAVDGEAAYDLYEDDGYTTHYETEGSIVHICANGEKSVFAEGKNLVSKLI